MNENINDLHQQAVAIATRFHFAESELIDVLQKIDDQKVFMKLGYSSLFEYAMKALKLSEANSSNFITVARKSKTVPELKMAIRNGDITVSKARKITPVLTKENSHHWLELAKHLPKPKLEKEVARVMPQTTTPEKAKYITESRLELKFGVSEDLMKRLRRAQDLVSQKLKKPANLEETLGEILAIYIAKQDPIEKAKRNIKSQSESVPSPGLHELVPSPSLHELVPSPVLNAAPSVPGTRYIPSQIKHQVHFRDQAKCTFTNSSGQKCENQRWLEIHHKLPLSLGGTNDLKNLTTLCHSHHRQQHWSQ